MGWIQVNIKDCLKQSNILSVLRNHIFKIITITIFILKDNTERGKKLHHLRNCGLWEDEGSKMLQITQHVYSSNALVFCQTIKTKIISAALSC